MTYIMLILFAHQSVNFSEAAMTTIEFKTKQQCEAAKHDVLSLRRHLKAVCVKTDK